MFIQWCNHEHRHSAIRFVTPAERHANLDTGLLQKRAHVEEEASGTLERRYSELAASSYRSFKPGSTRSRKNRSKGD